MTPDGILKVVREDAIQFIDLRYMDFPGVWRHHTVPAGRFDRRWFDHGVEIAAAVPGQPPRLLVPAALTAHVDPFCQHPTLALIGGIREAASGQNWVLSSRAVAERAEVHLSRSGLAQRAEFGAELQFFVFDQVCYDQSASGAHYRVDSREGAWRRGRDELDNLGTQVPPADGAGRLPPQDSLHNLRAEIVAALDECGIAADAHAHGPATAGHGGIALHAERLIETADKLATAKYVIRNVAARHGKVATFMPQPLLSGPGCGLPLQLALWKGKQNVALGRGTGLNAAGAALLEGLRRHAGSLAAFTIPTTNSFKRLAAAADDPARPAGLAGQREMVAASGAGLEYRLADALCDPYLALSAVLLAALDGMARGADRRRPVRGRSRTNAVAPTPLPATLDEALGRLMADHDYLLAGGVFPEPLIAAWVRHKLEQEVLPVRDRPHPYEFMLYFNG